MLLCLESWPDENKSNPPPPQKKDNTQRYLNHVSFVAREPPVTNLQSIMNFRYWVEIYGPKSVDLFIR